MEPLVSPRGLPEDLSENVKKEWKWYEEDCHTPTWYDLNELHLYCDVCKDFESTNEDEDYDKEAYESFIYFVKCIDHYLDLAQEWVWDKVEPCKYRVIIWFDS